MAKSAPNYAKNVAADNEDDDNIISKLNGATSIVLTDENGVEYKASFPRALVRKMQKEGVTAEYLSSVMGDSTVESVDEFFEKFVLPAFNVEQKMTLEQVEDLFEGLEDPGKVIEALMALYTLPVYALLGKKDPTKTRAKFRLV